MGREHWIQTFFTVAIGALTIMTPVILITVWALNSIHDLDARMTAAINRVELRQMELDATMGTRVTKIESSQSTINENLRNLSDSIRNLSDQQQQHKIR